MSVCCGFVLWTLTLGERWVQGSYDNLFRFGARGVTNQVVIILMDNEAFAELGQTRDRPWDRTQHTRLLNKLAEDRCPLVAMDVFFLRSGTAKVDDALREAMSRLSNLVLAADQSSATHPGLAAVRPTLPLETFLTAARTNWGVAWLAPDLDMIVRRHWPFPSPGPHPSLPWNMARLSGVRLSEVPANRWLRYYAPAGGWTRLSYHLALSKGPGYFRDKVVFIGTAPKTPLPDSEQDEFRTPYFKWTGETTGGVEILATAYLNLVNGDWLRRPAGGVEALLLTLTGAALGGALCRFRRARAVWLSLGCAPVLTVAGVFLSYYTNFWFPWLVVVGGQLPCALVWACMPAKAQAAPLPVVEKTLPEKPATNQTIVLSFPEDPLPDAPEYELFTPAIGQGGYGKVWLARNAIGQWQALKAVYQSKFGENRQPYETEFKGLQRYKPVSEGHPGLLRIDLVSKMKREGYFYYVMELGDAQTPGWERDPTLYKSMDLEFLRKHSPARRLPVVECLRIGTVLADALHFLHGQGLTHRDIKPSNVIFVNGRPKLAHVGLVADIRHHPSDRVHRRRTSTPSACCSMSSALAVIRAFSPTSPRLCWRRAGTRISST